jgi:hypothetical protein
MTLDREVGKTAFLPADIFGNLTSMAKTVEVWHTPTVFAIAGKMPALLFTSRTGRL